VVVNQQDSFHDWGTLGMNATFFPNFRRRGKGCGLFTP
jgi:hypothetical protein